ncbi:hypothetical protein AA313_de0200003 [Arthrobotrys entomopaga]|nr:hypothetical protein AA313_de0200003 [Arthrobotrys entomopaga]
MVKLTYRKITGVKLAQSVQRDIQKRIPNIGEDKKLAAVQRDPVVEVDISGRQLGPEGLAIVCDSIYNMGTTKLSRVEELNLSGNELTADCLPHLRRALSVCPDLHNLDISDNKINISTVEEMKEWKSFLTTFSDLRCVRKLDFSNNPLGDFAIEILFSVYAVEKEIFIPYDFSGLKEPEALDEATEVNYSVEGFDIRSQGGHLYLATHPEDNAVASTTHLGKISSTTIASQPSGILSSSPTSSVDHSRDPAEIHGLRAIPYIVMSNIGITDLGAMWMSFVIPEHPLPSELLPHLPPLKEGPLAASLRKYDTLPDFRGIVLTENSDITAVGQRVLKEAEDRRDQDAARVEELMTHGQGRRRSSTLTEDGENLTTRTQRLNIFHWARSRASIRNELEYVSESTETQTRRVLGKVKGLAYEL